MMNDSTVAPATDATSARRRQIGLVPDITPTATTPKAENPRRRISIHSRPILPGIAMPSAATDASIIQRTGGNGRASAARLFVSARLAMARHITTIGNDTASLNGPSKQHATASTAAARRASRERRVTMWRHGLRQTSPGSNRHDAQDRGLVGRARRLLEPRARAALHAPLALGPRRVPHRLAVDDAQVRVGRPPWTLTRRRRRLRAARSVSSGRSRMASRSRAAGRVELDLAAARRMHRRSRRRARCRECRRARGRSATRCRRGPRASTSVEQSLPQLAVQHVGCPSAVFQPRRRQP